MKLNIQHKIALGLALATVATASHAVVDVTAVVTTISEGIAACTSIGVAMLSVWALTKVYKLVRAM